MSRPEATTATRSYRSDIDGLRAIAVTSVMLYHLRNSWLPGGFVGVDVFFVISGFVVTGSALRKESSRPVLDLVHFWRRRWLRIAPALITCVLISLVVSAMLFAPVPRETYIGTLRTGIAALFGVGNLYLYRIGLDYFQADQSINVFSHTWSLGIEEQFYVAFSLSAILILRVVFGNRFAYWRVGLFAAATCVSLALFLYRSAVSPVANYYFLTSRLWELGAGCLLACVRTGDRVKPNQTFLGLSQVAAFCALVGSAFARTPPEAFPTWPIIVATAATGTLLMTGAFDTSGVARVLSHRAAVTIGLLSYSLYLWHWPVFSFFRYTVGLETTALSLTALLITAVAAFLSYQFVEQRWRHSTRPFATQLFPGFAVAVAGAVAISVVVQKKEGAFYLGTKRPWSTDWLPKADFAYGVRGSIRRTNCLISAGSKLPEVIPAECIATPLSAAGTPTSRLLVIGDSHAFADWGMVAYGVEKKAYQFLTYAHDGCPVFVNKAHVPESCSLYWEWVSGAIRRELNPGDIVFLSSFWPYLQNVDLEPALTRLDAIGALADSMRLTLIVEAPLPQFASPTYRCSKEWFRTNYQGCIVARAAFERQRSGIMAILLRFTSQSPRRLIWDPVPILCSIRCAQFDKDQVLFRDRDHLAYRGARSLGPAFQDFLSRERLKSQVVNRHWSLPRVDGQSKF